MNQHFFDTIDTEEKAYWLGFLFADGNLSKSSYTRKDGTIKNGCYRISLDLKGNDIDHLQKFADTLELNQTIKKSNGSFDTFRCRLGFNNKHMWTVLNNYGCTPRKSLTLKFPDISIFKNTWLIISFIRGYVDGDGCICHIDKDHTKMQIKILGTYDFLSVLQKQLPIEYDNCLYRRPTENVFELVFNSKRGAYISSILYNGATVYLKRKFEKHEELCRLYKGLYRVLPSKYGENCEVNPVVNNQITKG